MIKRKREERERERERPETVPTSPTDQIAGEMVLLFEFCY